jgi:Carbohydrate esterase, sialic acid-specific acetylesterase
MSENETDGGMRSVMKERTCWKGLVPFVLFCRGAGRLGAIAWFLVIVALSPVQADDDTTVRVFIFAGQSNMVGSDSKVQDIQQFPPFAGLQNPQPRVRFSYCLGRETKTTSEGWVNLQPVDNVVGPELSFARKVTQNIAAPIAIIKIAAGGTHLGGDWNPDEPSGFKMYPLALQWIQKALADLEKQGIKYRLEGFMWHQGENDMFNQEYMDNYGRNLKNFLASWRRDLKSPELRFYIGELCTKTIWGMDLRPRMYAISLGQKQVTNNDPFAQYVPTAHVGVEIGGGVGLHYHYGTLGQLEHGVNYADAYLRNIGQLKSAARPLKNWPYAKGSTVKLFVLAGHRNMEGETAFVQQLANLDGGTELLNDDRTIAYKYSIGGGYKVSEGWEPLGPAGFYDTFGPELSFGATLRKNGVSNIAIAKFTHSGSQIIDWTPEGSEAKSRNLYPAFIEFIQKSVQELAAKGHQVELAGIFYHLGENDMSWGPFRKGAPQRLVSLVTQSRKDLGQPSLKWYVSQQPPTDDKDVNHIDVTAELEQAIASASNLIHIQVFDLPEQEKKLVIDTRGIVWLGEAIAKKHLDSR